MVEKTVSKMSVSDENESLVDGLVSKVSSFVHEVTDRITATIRNREEFRILDSMKKYIFKRRITF
jgi:hypothetical protein